MKAETVLYNEIKRALEDLIPNRFHYQRIESGLTNSGIPDINICFMCRYDKENGHEIWIECKMGDEELNTFQRGWFKFRRAVGGAVYSLSKGYGKYVVNDTRDFSSIHGAISFILNNLEDVRCKRINNNAERKG